MTQRMSGWMNKLKKAVTAESDGMPKRARLLLRTAYQKRTKIELIETGGSVSHTPMICNIEQLGKNNIIVNQPTIGALTKPLVPGIPLLLSMNIDGVRVIGETKVLGRARIPSGGSKPFYGYRLDYPNDLREQSDRRELFRVSVAYELAPKTDLVRPPADDRDPVKRLPGVMHDLGIGGALVRAHADDIEAEMREILHVGERLVLQCALPPPVDEIVQLVTIRHIKEDRTEILIGVEFSTEVPGLPELVRLLDIRRSRRQRSA